MKYSILGQSPLSYQKRLKQHIGLCAAVLAITVGLNILFTALRSDSNHTLMLILNIAADVLCGFFLLHDTEMHILPMQRLYKLYCRDRQQLTGTVTHICDTPQRYMDIDCYAVTVDDRRVFLPAGTFSLRQESYTLSLVSNIIVEAAQ